jgi:phenylalanyl-tRNA synthetase beta subunit
MLRRCNISFGNGTNGKENELALCMTSSVCMVCSYLWRPSQKAEFFPGRQAEVLFGDAIIGAFGVVHPDVLEAFGVAFPVSAMELNLEPFCVDQNGRPLLEDLTSDVPIK